MSTHPQWDVCAFEINVFSLEPGNSPGIHFFGYVEFWGYKKYESTKSNRVTKPPSENGVKKIIGLSVKKDALFELASSPILAKAYDF